MVKRGVESKMTDLHEGRGPKRSKDALGLIAVAIFLICASFFVQGFAGPKWAEHGLTIGAIVALTLSAWVGARDRRGRKGG